MVVVLLKRYDTDGFGGKEQAETATRFRRAVFCGRHRALILLLGSDLLTFYQDWLFIFIYLSTYIHKYKLFYTTMLY